jgi:hypothetical protein
LTPWLPSATIVELMRWRWERIAALAGIVAVVLWIVGVIVQGEPPEEDEEQGAAATAIELLSWYQDETDTILAGGFIFMLGVLFFLVYLVALRLRLADAEGANGFLTLLASAAGIAMAIFMLAAPGADMTAALSEDELLPASAMALRNVSDVFFLGAELSAALLVAAVGLLAVRLRALPVWLGWISFLLALLLLILPIGWAGLIFGMPLWILATSVLLYLRVPAATPRAAPPPPPG